MDIPDVTVVDQTGAERHFYRDLVAGKTVAVNFVFTTCTTICPPMGANFGRLRRELGERAGRDLHLISVSVDPVTDTPERLAAWAEKFGAGDGWTLVTGERGEITRLLKALEVFTPDINDHSPVVLIGNDDAGNWTRAHGLAPPAKLEELLQKADAEAAAEAEGRG
jgi:cytochrome oxidase Cu insertion factor (SCO1/SenC/PrrC family)